MTSEPTQFSLSGRKALITGASRGLGRSLAMGLALAGADVAVTARNGEQLATLTSEIRGVGRVAHFVEANMADENAPEEIVQRSIDCLGGIDIVVCNAGIDVERTALKLDLTDWRSIVSLNLEAPFRVARAAASHMIARGGGKVIFISSVYGLVGGVGESAYSSTKHALVGLTRTLALEWGRRNIQVNAIAPGFILTDMTQKVWESEAGRAFVLSRTPAGRPGMPDDLVGAAVFLASNAANYVTGHVLVVDGGYTAQ
jgi:2-deoxy-D-gluconate 3-dehydrogenase